MNTKLLCTFILVHLAMLSTAETRVSGVIDNTARWSMARSPYLVTGDILIAKSGTLTIEPGVLVQIGIPSAYDDVIPQYDNTDSQLCAIKVQGALVIQGKSTRRVVFEPLIVDKDQSRWYGIVLDGCLEKLTDVRFADIRLAATGLTIKTTSPIIRNCLFEYNTVGIAIVKSDAQVVNCTIIRNSVAGITIAEAMPSITNSIISDNINNGIWCDGVVKFTASYNCLWNNRDGNFYECDPELGVAVIDKKKNKEARIPADKYANSITDPLFEEIDTTKSDTIPVDMEKELARSTVPAKSQKTDHEVQLNTNSKDSESKTSISENGSTQKRKYFLTAQSPCINAGNPDKKFNDADGSRNDIGMWGGAP